MVYMNQNHLNTLCDYFNLGHPIQAPERVFGGLLHIMWRLNTDKGSYAIKQLSKDIALSDEHVVKSYELSERVAFDFNAQEVPAVSALQKNDKHLYTIDAFGFLVYPWVDSTVLGQHVISEEHALKIAVILAKMHRLNLNEPEITEPKISIYTKEKIIKIIKKAQRFDCPFAVDLQKYQENILAANEAYQRVIPLQNIEAIVTHGDLDQKNVLWDKDNNPVLIDWESACKVNPTYDFITTAFYWSGITTDFNQSLFLKMIETYKNAGGMINIDHALLACYGPYSWIDWLVFNIERACVSRKSENQKIGIQEVNQTLAGILRLQILVPQIIKLISEIK